MSVPAWQVSTWPLVRRTPRQWIRLTRRLLPLGISVNVDDVAGGLRYGQALWGTECRGDAVGIAWDWRELRPDVVAMSDPMTVLSNLVLVDDHGFELNASRRVILLNTTIYQLGWQARLSVLPVAAGEPLPMAA